MVKDLSLVQVVQRRLRVDRHHPQMLIVQLMRRHRGWPLFMTFLLVRAAIECEPASTPKRVGQMFGAIIGHIVDADWMQFGTQHSPRARLRELRAALLPPACRETDSELGVGTTSALRGMVRAHWPVV